MTYSIILQKAWPYRHPRNGRSILESGRYRVPDEVPEVVAERAVAEGIARREAIFGEIFDRPSIARVAAKPERPLTEAIVADPAWGGVAIVAASGPSLSPELAALCAGFQVIAVNDAYRLFPAAAMLYACDEEWWTVHDGCGAFAGEKWSSHGDASFNDKREVARRFGLRLVRGGAGQSFSRDPALIHYGEDGGFQAINIALHKIGFSGRIILVGFDMRRVDGKSHFFGEHPRSLRTTTQAGYRKRVKLYADAAKRLPGTVEIINCTPDSALTGFKTMDLADALSPAA